MYLIFGLIIVVFISGCVQKETTKEKFPEQEAQIVPEEKVTTAEPAKELEKPKTEIIAKGRKGAELVISPSVDEAIKGTVTLTIL